MHKKTIKIKELSDESAINVALDTISINKQALYFVNSKRSAEAQAEKISKKIKDSSDVLEKLSKEILHLSRPTKQCERLSIIIKKGVAFHHSGLTSKQREIIEDNFRNGNVKIICSTPTLAAGVDLPAFRSIIKDLKRFSGARGMRFIPILEYLQQAGRAGRPGKEEYGEAVIFASSEREAEELVDMYINGEPEEIYSKLAVEPVLRTYVLSLVATDFLKTKKELIDFFSETFYAKQFKDTNKLEMIISKMIELLEGYEFIKVIGKKKELFISADELSDEKLTATPLGKRVAELYIDPYTANYLIEGIKKRTAQDITDFSYLQLISSTFELRPLINVKQKEFIHFEERLSVYEDYLLTEPPNYYDDEYYEFLNSVKTAFFFLDWINEDDEEILLDRYGIRPGEIKVKLDAAKWLIYSMSELTKLLGFSPLIKEFVKLRIRIINGAKEELLPLLRLKQVGRVRARKLFQNNIKGLGDVRKADRARLSQILGKKIAESIKEQVSIEEENDEEISVQEKLF